MARRRSSRRRSSRGGGGNGIITGILIGMILAVGAVAVLMWYMNSQPNKLQQPQTQSQDPNEYQRPQRPATPVTTEIIRPQDAGVPPLQTEVVQETPAVPETTVAEDTATTDKTEKKEIAKKEASKDQFSAGRSRSGEYENCFSRGRFKAENRFNKAYFFVR